jgi:hypothetical protein
MEVSLVAASWMVGRGGRLSRDGVSDRYELVSGCKLRGGREARECRLGTGGLTKERY